MEKIIIASINSIVTVSLRVYQKMPYFVKIKVWLQCILMENFNCKRDIEIFQLDR